MGHGLLACIYGKAHSGAESSRDLLSCDQPRRRSSPKIQKEVHWLHVLGQCGYEPRLLPGKKYPTWNGSDLTRHPLSLPPVSHPHLLQPWMKRKEEDLLDKSFRVPSSMQPLGRRQAGDKSTGLKATSKSLGRNWVHYQSCRMEVKAEAGLEGWIFFILFHKMNHIINFRILIYFLLPSTRTTGPNCAPASHVRTGLIEKDRKCEL